MCNASVTRDIRVIASHRWTDDRGQFEELYNKVRFADENGFSGNSFKPISHAPTKVW